MPSSIMASRPFNASSLPFGLGRVAYCPCRLGTVHLAALTERKRGDDQVLGGGAGLALKQRKMVLKGLPRVRAGYGATLASHLRSKA